jgi:hypothetical protein
MRYRRKLRQKDARQANRFCRAWRDAEASKVSVADAPGWSKRGHTARIEAEPFISVCGAVAQLGERLVRNEEATGSIPVSSTIFSTTCGPFVKITFTMEPLLLEH